MHLVMDKVQLPLCHSRPAQLVHKRDGHQMLVPGSTLSLLVSIAQYFFWCIRLSLLRFSGYKHLMEKCVKDEMLMSLAMLAQLDLFIQMVEIALLNQSLCDRLSGCRLSNGLTK